MNQLNLFIELTRLKKPIGYMLLFWPCAWGLTVAYDFSKDLNNYLFYLTLFLLGAVLMRSAGCIVNDISDRKFDKQVQRTKTRPIASGEISVKLGFFYTAILCFLAFFVLLNFNNLTIILALGSMPLAFSYPLMKRYTYWPQFFLGITFNYGLILGWICIKENLEIVPFFFYFIGIKATSIKFKKKPYFFLALCYLIFFLSIASVGVLMKFNFMYFVFLIIPLLHLFIHQIKKLDINDPNKCLKIFKSNNFFGLIVFVNLLIGKLH